MIVQKHLVRDLMYLYTSIISAGMRNIVSLMSSAKLEKHRFTDVF